MTMVAQECHGTLKKAYDTTGTFFFNESESIFIAFHIAILQVDVVSLLRVHPTPAPG